MESRSAVLVRFRDPEVTGRLKAARDLMRWSCLRKIPPVACVRGAAKLTWVAARWAMIGR